MTEPVKLCKDCRHMGRHMPMHHCARPPEIDAFRPLEGERFTDVWFGADRCGPSGKYWEER